MIIPVLPLPDNPNDFSSMNLLTKWLSGKRNYHVGVVLYDHFGTDKKLKQLFSSNPDAYRIKRLEQAIAELAKLPSTVLVHRKPNEQTDEMPATGDPVLEALRNEWSPLYQRMQYLRHELDRIPGNTEEAMAQRKPIAYEILDLEQQCMKAWTRRDHYLQHGNLPEVSDKEFKIPTSPTELAKFIDTTKRNLRRNIKLAKDHPDNTVYPLKVIKFQELMDKINKKINDAKGTKE
jgi:hypothetical protein